MLAWIPLHALKHKVHGSALYKIKAWFGELYNGGYQNRTLFKKKCMNISCCDWQTLWQVPLLGVLHPPCRPEGTGA